MLTGAERGDRRPHLRPRPGRAARARRRRSKAALGGIDGLVDLHVELQVDDPAGRGRGRPRRGPALRPQARRRAPGRRPRCWPARRSATSSATARSTTCSVWSTPETRHSLDSIRELLIDTPGGGHVRLGDVADVRVAPTPNVDQARGRSRAASTSAPTCAAATSARSSRDVEQRLERGRVPARVPRRSCSASTPSAQAAQSRLLVLRRSPPLIGDLPPAAGRLRQLAPGGRSPS